jgi:hypothetical protein
VSSGSLRLPGATAFGGCGAVGEWVWWSSRRLVSAPEIGAEIDDNQHVIGPVNVRKKSRTCGAKLSESRLGRARHEDI